MTPLDQPRRAVLRVTVEGLDHSHGANRGRPLCCRLAPGDLLELWPKGTRRPQLRQVVRLVDVYAWAIRCAVNRARLEQARERKAQLGEARERARLRRSITRGKL